MFGLIPKNESFFEFFDGAANNILTGARLLDEILGSSGGDLETRVKTMKDIEHAGDKITHDTVKRLNQTFVTPIDREDIHALICALDDAMDLLDEVASKFFLYKLSDPPKPVMELSGIILKCAEETVRAVVDLEKLDSTIHHICIEINSLENEADRIKNMAIAALFDEIDDTKSLIKWKEIYETLEDAVDSFEDIANILEGILVKHL